MIPFCSALRPVPALNKVILREKCRKEKWTAHTLFMLTLLFAISGPVLVSSLLDTENETRMMFQVADTETKGLFMVCHFCLLCPLETGFSNIRSLLNPGFKAIFIQHEMCMDRKPLEIKDSTVCFSSRSPLCSLKV